MMSTNARVKDATPHDTQTHERFERKKFVASYNKGEYFRIISLIANSNLNYLHENSPLEFKVIQQQEFFC